MFPTYQFEPGFTETDELWRATESETDAAFGARAKAVLDDVFTTDKKSTWISITAHSGAVAKLLEALNHRPFRLATGQIIPVLVTAEVIEKQPTPTFEAHEPYSTCDAPPVTSIAGQGCVCATATTGTGLLAGPTGV
jgi:broad specificity phosphatase PhoE